MKTPPVGLAWLPQASSSPGDDSFSAPDRPNVPVYIPPVQPAADLPEPEDAQGYRASAHRIARRERPLSVSISQGGNVSCACHPKRWLHACPIARLDLVQW